MVNQAFYIGKSPPAQSYLNFQNIIDIAKKTGAEAIHPGYGFLSENGDFVNNLKKEGIEFIGPPAQAIK